MKRLNALLMTLMTAASLYIAYDTWVGSKKLANDNDTKCAKAANACYVPFTRRLGSHRLALRRQPAQNSRVIAALPNHGIAIRGTGRTAISGDGSVWVEVEFRGLVGWVEATNIVRFRKSG